MDDIEKKILTSISNRLTELEIEVRMLKEEYIPWKNNITYNELQRSQQNIADLEDIVCELSIKEEGGDE